MIEEGRSGSPKMMSVGLHCRLAGRPGRAMALKRFLDYINSFSDVWIARRIDIANHWKKTHPPRSSSIVPFNLNKKEFIEYKLPTWLRDLVGILKLSFSVMIISSDKNLVWIGSMGIIVLMIGALGTHFRVKNPLQKMIPAIALSSLCLSIIYFNNIL